MEFKREVKLLLQQNVFYIVDGYIQRYYSTVNRVNGWKYWNVNMFVLCKDFFKFYCKVYYIVIFEPTLHHLCK
jgi:hypothetical protein